MSATETLAAPFPAGKVSQYRSLRGKSVSESRDAVDKVSLKQEEQAGIASGLFKNASARYRKRAKTLDDKQQDQHRNGTNQGQAPTIPPLPQSISVRTAAPISPLPLARLQNGKFVVQTTNTSGRPDDGNHSNAAATAKSAAYGNDDAIGQSGFMQGPGYEVAGIRPGAAAGPSATDAGNSDNPLNKATAHSQHYADGATGLAITSHATAPTAAFNGVHPVGIAVTHTEESAAPNSPDGVWNFAGCESPIDQALEQRRRRQQQAEEAEAEKWADEVAHLEAETDRILAEQRKKDLARAQKQYLAPKHQQLRAVSSTSSLSGAAKSKSPVLEKFAFLARGRRSNAATLSPTSSMYSSNEFNRANSLEPNLLPSTFIEPGGKGIVPLTDAPLSASNGAERRVTVRCKGMTLNLAVNVETSAMDILQAAAGEMSHPVNVATSVILETYNSLGLERRLRLYERVREVLNSWDRDTQNSLVILPDTFEGDQDLEFSSVSQTQTPPEGFVMQLYHSQRPGKWSKRFITLLTTGQIMASKKAEATSTADKDAQILCHLSDFDIYTPTEAQMRKQLKPPKKLCYAIKSQQKTTVFLSTENYVHFFCTEDRGQAHQFHSRIHAWRSWYLANRLVELQKKKEEDRPPQIANVRHKPRKSIGHVKVNGHKLKVSVDEAPYTIGQFQPLLDLKRSEKPLNDFGSDWEVDRSKLPPVPTDATWSKKEAKRGNTDEAAFASDGLLGNAYDERKKAAAKKSAQEKADAEADAPFTEGPNLLNGGAAPKKIMAQTLPKKGETSTTSQPKETHQAPKGAPAPGSAPPPVHAEPARPEASSWFPSAAVHTARSRSVSSRYPSSRPNMSAGPVYDRDPCRQQKRQPAPLLDLTPKFVEAPQWNRSGKGRGVEVPEGMLLIDMISTGTSNTNNPGSNNSRLLEPPPRNLTRRETGGAPQRPGTSDGRSGLTRSRSIAASSSGGSSARRGVSTSGSDPYHSTRAAPGAPPLPPLPPNSSRSGNAFPLPPRPGTSGSATASVRSPPQHQYAEERGRDPRPRDHVQVGRSQRSGSVRV